MVLHLIATGIRKVSLYVIDTHLGKLLQVNILFTTIFATHGVDTQQEPTVEFMVIYSETLVKQLTKHVVHVAVGKKANVI